MNASLRPLFLATAFAGLAALAAAPRAAEPATGSAAPPMPPQRVLMRVTVNANGRVLTAQNLDPQTPPAVLVAAQEIASKLVFTPATKNGRPIGSETSLSMTLALVPRASGGFGMSLRRAQNGPSVLTAQTVTPNVSRENGGIVVVGVDLLADGSLDMKTFKPEKVELRTPSSFAEQRFVEAARKSLKDARFMLDKVEGIDIPSRLSIPFSFNGGMRKPEREEGLGGRDRYGEEAPTAKPSDAPQDDVPSLTAVSRIEGITLPKIDFVAPPAPPAK
jgi:hypothetical protein